MVLPQEEVVLLPSVVMPRSLLVVLLLSRELPDFVSGFGTGGGAISEEGIGIVLDRIRYPCWYGVVLVSDYYCCTRGWQQMQHWWHWLWPTWHSRGLLTRPSHHTLLCRC